MTWNNMCRYAYTMMHVKCYKSLRVSVLTDYLKYNNMTVKDFDRYCYLLCELNVVDSTDIIVASENNLIIGV